MNTYLTKSQESKSRSVGREPIQKRSGGKLTLLHADNRSGAVAQRKLQDIANNSQQAKQLKAFQEMANGSPGAGKEVTPVEGHGSGVNAGPGLEVVGEQGAVQCQVIQRAKKEQAVTGVTHLVKMVSGTLYDGNQLSAVRRGDYVVIETSGSYHSRRGPNQEVEVNRETDRTGPQHYVWYPVITLNGVEMGPDVFIRDDTIEDLQDEETGKEALWLTFGVDGKNLEQLQSAVKKGYRRFDCAEGYGNTRDVARALRAEKVPRNDVEIVYKFDLLPHEERGALMGRLMPVIELFGGRLDVLMIHNATGERDAMTQAWSVMNALKKSGLVGKVGMGNIKADQEDLLTELNEAASVDVVENSASSVMADEELQELIKNLGADLTYYDVIGLAKEMGIFSHLDSDEERKTAIEALVFRLQNVSDVEGFKSHMILSSRDPGRQQANLESFGKGATRGGAPARDADVAGYITHWVNSKNVCDSDGPDVVLPGNVRTFLEHADWAGLRHAISESGQEILAYVVDQNTFSLGDLQDIKVPARAGLKRRYVGWSLDYILDKLLGGVTCEHQPAQELISTLVFDAATWAVIKDSLGKVV